MRTRTWALLGLLASGCAGYSVERDGQGKGYDVYSPDPYLLRKPIESNTGEITGFTFEVVWLPNITRRYRVHSWAGFGQADFSFDYQEGWKLTKVVDKSDNSKVLSTLLELTKHLVPANPFKLDSGQGVLATKAGVDTGDRGLKNASMVPVLYRIEFDETTGCCVGLKPVGEFPSCGRFPVSAVGAASPSPGEADTRAK